MLSIKIDEFVSSVEERKRLIELNRLEVENSSKEKNYQTWLETEEVKTFRSFLGAFSQLLDQDKEGTLPTGVFLTLFTARDKTAQICLQIPESSLFSTIYSATELNVRVCPNDPSRTWINSQFVTRFLEEEATGLASICVKKLSDPENACNFIITCEKE